VGLRGGVPCGNGLRVGSAALVEWRYLVPGGSGALRVATMTVQTGETRILGEEVGISVLLGSRHAKNFVAVRSAASG